MMSRELFIYTAVAVGTMGLLAMAVPSGSSSAVPKSPASPKGYEELERLGRKVDPYIPGFSKFAQAVAYTESRGNAQAVNDSPSEAQAACRGYERNADSRYRDNPYPPEDWCWGSGGWFGFLPSTALAAPGFEDLDPLLVLDPEAQVAMFADYIRRVVHGNWKRLPAEERTWLAVRRFMAGNTVGLDWREEKVLKSDTDGVPRAAKTRKRFAKALKAVGLPSSFMYQRVHIQSWPGAVRLWEELD